MKSRRRLRRSLSRILDSLLLVVLGADMLLAYFHWTGPSSPQIDEVRPIVSGAFWLLFWAGMLVRPYAGGPSAASPSPRWSGTMVVVITGFVATLLLGRGSPSGGDPVAAFLVAIGTLIAAALVWRFATLHAGEIGEARFDTSGTTAPRG